MKRLFLVTMDEKDLALFDRWRQRGSAENAVTALMGPLTAALKAGDLIELNYELNYDDLERLEERKDEIGRFARNAIRGRGARIKELQLENGIDFENEQRELMAIFEPFMNLNWLPAIKRPRGTRG